MTILGLYCGHDANTALVRDGEVIGHYLLDRTARVKHARGYALGHIEEVLKHCSVSWDDIDAVAVGGSFVSGTSGNGEFELQLREQAKSSRALYWKTLTTSDPADRVYTDEITINGRTVPIYHVDHHLSHCAVSYYSGPYAEANVFSFDGGGDGGYHLAAVGKNGKLSDLWYNNGSPRPEMAIGGMWSDVHKWYKGAGLRPIDHEGKIMGHAAYGTPRPEWVAYVRDCMEHYQSRRSAGEWDDHLEKFRAEAGDFTSFHNQDAMDLSASLQTATEDALLTVMGEYMEAHPASSLCMSGGVLYNCSANTALAAAYPNIFVTSCPHDGGLALGAAMYVWYQIMDNPFSGVAEFSPFLGYGCGESGIEAAEEVVDDLLNGKIVAWFNGRAESGNRALGNRSILVDPRIPNIKDIINNRVKQREWFRPFAPSVLADHTEWVDGAAPPSTYMSFACQVKKNWWDKVPGVVHVDGTCRPQFVTPTINPVYYLIISLFYEATGIPMILNTSLNLQEPIVDTTEHAKRAFESADIDVLYLNGCRTEK